MNPPKVTRPAPLIQKRQAQKRQSHAQQALKEAALRKEEIDMATSKAKGEKNGRGGLDPARFGDWEIKGIASDF